jgi:hypothetical protein
MAAWRVVGAIRLPPIGAILAVIPCLDPRRECVREYPARTSDFFDADN